MFNNKQNKNETQLKKIYNQDQHIFSISTLPINIFHSYHTKIKIKITTLINIHNMLINKYL